MKLAVDTCSRCGKTSKVVQAENKLVGNICLSCLSQAIDFDDAKDLKMLSETLRIPFNPNQFYLAQMNANSEIEALEQYLEYLEEHYDDPEVSTRDGKHTAFDKINEEWAEIKDHHKLLISIPLFKDEFISRNQSKWGYNFSFEQLIRLENLYTSALKTYGISDPIKRDAVRKAAITSLKLDDSILEGNNKETIELTKSYQALLSIAGIDKIAGTAADDGTIRTVADLISYLEKRDYKVESNFVENKDIVDMTLDNILENTRLILSEKTGLDVEMRDIIEKAQASVEESIAAEVYERDPILVEDFYEEVERELEADLSKDEDFDMEEVNFLGE